MHKPMDLSEWVNCDNKIPPFEPPPEAKPSNKAYGLYDGQGKTQVTQCDIPQLSVRVELKGIGVYFLSVLRGHPFWPRMDRVIWNNSSNELLIYYGDPSPSYILPPVFDNQETIATILVWPNTTAITQNMITNYK